MWANLAEDTPARVNVQKIELPNLGFPLCDTSPSSENAKDIEANQQCFGIKLHRIIKCRRKP